MRIGYRFDSSGRVILFSGKAVVTALPHHA